MTPVVRSPLTILFFASSFAMPALASEPEPFDASAAATGAARSAASAGAYLGWTEHARTDTHQGMLSLHSGHSTGLGWAHSGFAELVLVAPGSARAPAVTGRDLGIAIRARGFTAGRDEELRGELGAKVQFLFQRDSGVDLSATLSYQNEGFNLRPAVASMITASTNLAELTLLGNLSYGHGLADEERYGAVRVALLGRVLDELRIGVDSKLELDLELDDDEPEGEPQLIAQAGPALTWAWDAVAVSAQGGVSVVQLRFEEARVGGVGVLGVAAVF